jgi:hypothetical protein
MAASLLLVSFGIYQIHTGVTGLVSN